MVCKYHTHTEIYFRHRLHDRIYYVTRNMMMGLAVDILQGYITTLYNVYIYKFTQTKAVIVPLYLFEIQSRTYFQAKIVILDISQITACYLASFRY